MADLRELVESWLRELGCEPEANEHPQTAWDLKFEYPVGSGNEMHAAQPKGKDKAVLLACITPVHSRHVKAFEALADDEKRDFQIDLRRNLNRVEVDYQIHGSEGPLDCPESYQVSATRFRDGLSLDSFARSVGAIYKAKLDSVLFIQKRLEPRAEGNGGRFDFERMGF